MQQQKKEEVKQSSVQAAFPSITPADLSLTVRLYITQESYQVIKKKILAKNAAVDFDKAIQASKKTVLC